ncbi:YtnP family quorum-quenching lactonase [Mesobacillus zeae]|uniref:MBL fold metallo-hydrolase n=1 Tax=Mesobacillus zeae TaxID=1917180 RepID=A0A398AZJ8_9BACI|nr:MBL fold metallo-hydrolase [Mesobacillus zeae]RID83089.1 MBL fold metallo-hydrolase [Mesobacillus zeae]
MERLKLQNVTLTWLDGGVTHLDGGAMFGVVPKALWSRKYKVNENNQIELRTDPILIQADGVNYLMETGIGSGKLDERQKRNFGVTAESRLLESLDELGIVPGEIDFVLMTHMHFDHACGLTERVDGEYQSVFPNARIITSDVEWAEIREPNIRSQNTYWKENWEEISGQVETFTGEWSHGPIRMVHTGGHSDGHSILIVEDVEDTVIHMADLMPTHAHMNPLWVLAYDDYPMDSIAAKEKWMKYGKEKQVWFTFYHDAVYRAFKLDQDGKIGESIERQL